MSSQRKVGAALSYINIIVKNLVTFFYTPFLLSHVGQAEYGLFQMTNSIIASLSILSMGLSSAYVKFYISYKVKKNQKKINQLNALYLVMFLIIAVVSLLIGIVLAFNSHAIFHRNLSNEEIQLTQQLMLILGFNLALTFPSSVFDSNIIANEQFKFQQFRQLLQSILVPIIAVPLILFGMNVLAIGITTSLITVVFLILNARYCILKLGMKFSFHGITLTMIKPLLMFSFFILLNQIVDIVNNNGPSFILGITLGAKQVAVFAIAIQIKNLFFMLSTSLSSVFIPKVNELVNSVKSIKPITELMIRVGRIQMTILFFILGGFIVLGEYFIRVWAGNENFEAYYLIIAMVLPSVIPLSQNIGIEVQRAMNMHIFRSISYLFFAVINLLLTYFGTKIFGLKGSVFGYIFSMLFANGILMNWYYHVKMHLDMKKYWLSVIQVSIPFVFVTALFKFIELHLIIDSVFLFVMYGVMYTLVYFIIYYFFIANRYEKSQLKIIKKKD